MCVSIIIISSVRHKVATTIPFPPGIRKLRELISRGFSRGYLGSLVLCDMSVNVFTMLARVV